MSCDLRDSPLVSVVVPAFKHESFVVPALQSVFDQDYPNIELIVVDDASPDGTAREIGLWAGRRGVASRFNGVRFVSNPVNAGAHVSLNRGCEMARGHYLALLNSDDLFHPSRLSKLIARLVEVGRGVAFSRVVPIDMGGKPVSLAAVPRELVGVFQLADQVYANSPEPGKELVKGNYALSTGNFVFHRDIYRAIGPFCDLKYCHDWDFILRSTLLAAPVYVPEDLYFYRVHGGNSFSQLANVAELETRIVLARYRSARARGQRIRDEFNAGSAGICSTDRANDRDFHVSPRIGPIG